MNDIESRLARITFIVTDVDGVLTDGKMGYDAEGRPFRFFNARDAVGTTLWRLAGGRLAVVSGLGSQAVEAIAAQWRCVECHGFIKDKARLCHELAERQGISLEDMAFLGDDLIDMRAIQAVGLGVAVADAIPQVKAAARLTLDTPGGAGALRELIERILCAQGRYGEIVEQYLNRKDGQA